MLGILTTLLITGIIFAITKLKIVGLIMALIGAFGIGYTVRDIQYFYKDES